MPRRSRSWHSWTAGWRRHSLKPPPPSRMPWCIPASRTSSISHGRWQWRPLCALGRLDDASALLDLVAARPTGCVRHLSAGAVGPPPSPDHDGAKQRRRCERRVCPGCANHARVRSPVLVGTYPARPRGMADPARRSPSRPVRCSTRLWKFSRRLGAEPYTERARVASAGELSSTANALTHEHSEAASSAAQG